MQKSFEQTTIEQNICPKCGKRFMVRLKMSDICDIKGWIMATQAKQQYKESYKEHVENCT